MDESRTSIGDLLVGEYSITPQSIVDGPRGFVAETYIVNSSDRRRFFAKVLPTLSRREAATHSLPVLEDLHALGIDTISTPVRTRDGRLTSELQGHTMILFDYIEGSAGIAVFSPSFSINYDFAQYVALLARVHGATSQVRSAMPHEDFCLPFANRFEQLFERILRGGALTMVQAELQHLMWRYQEQITIDWSTLLSLSQVCQLTDWTPLITHGDALGDNLIMGRDGRLYLVDWDELMLGPAERDTWFYLNDDAWAMSFLHLYRKAFPLYRPDQSRHRFYLFRRFFEDLTDYLSEILESAAVSHQQKNLAELQETCFRWLWPTMRRSGNPNVHSGDIG